MATCVKDYLPILLTFCVLFSYKSCAHVSCDLIYLSLKTTISPCLATLVEYLRVIEHRHWALGTRRLLSNYTTLYDYDYFTPDYDTDSLLRSYKYSKDLRSLLLGEHEYSASGSLLKS